MRLRLTYSNSRRMPVGPLKNLHELLPPCLKSFVQKSSYFCWNHQKEKTVLWKSKSIPDCNQCHLLWRNKILLWTCKIWRMGWKLFSSSCAISVLKGKRKKNLIRVILDPVVLAIFKFWFHKFFVIAVQFHEIFCIKI